MGYRRGHSRGHGGETGRSLFASDGTPLPEPERERKPREPRGGPVRLPEPTYSAPGALEPLSDTDLEEASRLRPCDVALLRAIAHGEVSLRGAASRIRALEVLSKRGHRRPKAFQRGTDPDALRPRILRLEAPASAPAVEPEPGPAPSDVPTSDSEPDPNR